MKGLQERIEEIMVLVAEVANGNFEYQLESSETGDQELDALIAGVSMLGQELKSSTVSRDFMQSIYQGVVDMLLILNKDFSIRTVNDAFEELLGYKEEELQGLPFSQIVQINENAGLPALLEGFKEYGKYLNEELLFFGKQNQKIPVSCSLSYLTNNQKEVDGILIIAKDITRQKQNEKELREAKERAEAANEAKSNFLSSMSHEIRTPLNGIMGFTDLLLETPLSPDQEQYINLIKTSGTTLTHLLKDILDLHRIEQDKIALEIIPFSFRNIIASNLDPYKHLAKGKDIIFSYTVDDSIPDWVQGDPTRIGQVLTNLVSNAIKFTEVGYVKVEFRAEQAEPGCFNLICTVTDTGIGIARDKQELIFDSFTQSDQSTSRKFGGFGLGLTISKKLTQLMQGSITVKSPLPGLNTGSIFTFTVKSKEYQKDNSPLASLNKTTNYQLPFNTQILIVDDNEMNIMLIQRVLKNFGANVTTAESGEKALELITDHDFNIVFMDIQMPGMDGLETAQKIRKMKIDVPIIGFSANAFADDIQKGLNSGMDDYLSKPFTRQELILILKNWVVNS